jgi:hypothetical protein
MPSGAFEETSTLGPRTTLTQTSGSATGCCAPAEAPFRQLPWGGAGYQV